MQFDSKDFCPYMIDKSTPLKKFLYCTKNKNLCKMVTYFPSGQIAPKVNVKETGCPYGYVIQDIGKKNQVTSENNVLDDISMNEKNQDIEPKQKRNTKKSQAKNTKKSTKNKKTTNTKKTKTKKKNT